MIMMTFLAPVRSGRCSSGSASLTSGGDNVRRQRRHPRAERAAEIPPHRRLAAPVRSQVARGRRRGRVVRLGAPRPAEPGVRDDRRRTGAVRALHRLCGAARVSALRHVEAPGRGAERDGRSGVGCCGHATPRSDCARDRQGGGVCRGARAGHRRRLPRARPAAHGLDLDVPLEGGHVRVHPGLRDRNRHQPGPLAAGRPRHRRLVHAAALGNDRGDPGHERHDARRRCRVARAAPAHALRASRSCRGP